LEGLRSRLPTRTDASCRASLVLLVEDGLKAMLEEEKPD
jgi:hypothetical protein